MSKRYSSTKAMAKLDLIEPVIRMIRGQRVILDADLARVYGVKTARLNQQVNRNLKKFPDDFMFRLEREEFNDLMLQNATSKKGRGGPASFLTPSPNTALLWRLTFSTANAPSQ